MGKSKKNHKRSRNERNVIITKYLTTVVACVTILFTQGIKGTESSENVIFFYAFIIVLIAAIALLAIIILVKLLN